MAIQREKVREWLINRQHDTVVGRYNDIPEGREIAGFFAKYLYPSMQDRRGYEYRNELFRKIADIYTRGKLRHELGPAWVLYAPLIWMADRIRELPQYLKRMVAIYDTTNELDGRVIDWMSEKLTSPSELTEENYAAAMRATSTLVERRAQVNEVVDIGGYAVRLVERGGIVDVIINYVPRIPFFVNNQYVRGINEAIAMVQSGFRAFKNQKGRLQEFKELCRERELTAIDEIFSV